MSEHISDPINEVVERMRKQFEAMTPEQKKAAEDRRKQSEVESMQMKVRELRVNWNAPTRHLQDKEMDRIGPWGAHETKLSKMLGTGFIVALVGGRGSGKTQMAVALMKMTTEQLRTAYYNTLTGLFLKIKATFKGDVKETEDDLIRRMAQPDFLVLDEVGRRSDSDWENRMIYELIDRRYCNMKDTLLIANQSKQQFLEAIGESFASRMQETGGIIECNWQSYRL